MKCCCCLFVKQILLYRAVNDSPLGISSVWNMIWMLNEHMCVCVLSVSLVGNLFKKQFY